MFVFDESAFLLLGMPPVDLIAMKRAKIKSKVSKDNLPGALPLAKVRLGTYCLGYSSRAAQLIT